MSIRYKIFFLILIPLLLVSVVVILVAATVAYKNQMRQSHALVSRHLDDLASQLDTACSQLHGFLQNQQYNGELRSAAFYVLRSGSRDGAQYLEEGCQVAERLRRLLQGKTSETAALYDASGLRFYASGTTLGVVRDAGFMIPATDTADKDCEFKLWRPGAWPQGLPGTIAGPEEVEITIGVEASALMVQGTAPLRITTVSSSGHVSPDQPLGVLLLRRGFHSKLLDGGGQKGGERLLSVLLPASGECIGACLDQKDREWVLPQADAQGEVFTSVLHDDAAFNILVRPYRRDGEVVAYLTAYAPREEVTEQVRHIVLLQLYGLAVGLVMAMLLAFWLGGVIATPIIRLAQGMRDVAKRRDFQIMLPPGNKDETGDLARSCNAMLQELKEAYISLQSAQERYRSLVDNALEGIYETTPAGRLISANPALARIMGYSSVAELLRIVSDAALQLYVEPQDRATFLQLLERHDVLDNYVIRMRRLDGEIIWVETHACAIRDEQGNLVSIQGLMGDITERKRAQDQLDTLNSELKTQVEKRTAELQQRAGELEAANARLKELDVLKSSVLSTVSHDLRTPMTSIQGFAKLIRRDFQRFFSPVAEKDSVLRKRGKVLLSNVEIIEQECQRLTRLVNDFLDLSRIESGHMDWQNTEICVVTLVARVLGALEGCFADRSALCVRTEIEEKLPHIEVDPDRMEQVLMNLFTNALKFTSKGQITVSGGVMASGGLRIAVADTGCGIAPEELPHIFDSYYRVINSDTLPEGTKGTGLGLAIAHNIVEHYGGRLWAESELGKGSTFYVDLPAAVCRPIREHSRTN